MKVWHPLPLKKSKSWGPFWSYQLNSTANPAGVNILTKNLIFCPDVLKKAVILPKHFFKTICRSISKNHLMIKVARGSSNSTNFGYQENRVIRGIVLIGDWLNTKTHEISQFPFFIKKPCYSLQKLSILRYYWIKMSLFLTVKQLIFTCVRIFMSKRLGF